MAYPAILRAHIRPVDKNRRNLDELPIVVYDHYIDRASGALRRCTVQLLGTGLKTSRGSFLRVCNHSLAVRPLISRLTTFRLAFELGV